MHFFQVLYDELIGFLGIGQLLNTFKTGNYSSLLTLNGIFSAISPLMPLLLLIEIVRAFLYKKFKVSEYRIPFLIYICNRFISRYLSIAAVAFCIGLFEKYELIKTTFRWYWLLYGYIVWEFSHFIYHYLGHKVRLFWCLHSTHHAPENMNLSISYAHFFLEAPYADVIRTSICILSGVNPPLLFLIMFKDVARAPGIKNKFLYIFMPPGWSHTGCHKTAKSIRNEFLANTQVVPAVVTAMSEG